MRNNTIQYVLISGHSEKTNTALPPNGLMITPMYISTSLVRILKAAVFIFECEKKPVIIYCGMEDMKLNPFIVDIEHCKQLLKELKQYFEVSE